MLGLILIGGFIWLAILFPWLWLAYLVGFFVARACKPKQEILPSHYNGYMDEDE